VVFILNNRAENEKFYSRVSKQGGNVSPAERIINIRDDVDRLIPLHKQNLYKHTLLAFLFFIEHFLKPLLISTICPRIVLTATGYNQIG